MNIRHAALALLIGSGCAPTVTDQDSYAVRGRAAAAEEFANQSERDHDEVRKIRDEIEATVRSSEAALSGMRSSAGGKTEGR